MDKLKVIADFMVFVESQLPEIEETEETIKWEAELQAEQDKHFEEMINNPELRPLKPIYKSNYDLDIGKASEEDASRIYLQGLKDSFTMMKNIGVIDLWKN